MKPFDYNKYLKNNRLLKEVEEGFNPIKRMKDFAGEKGWTFSARRPTDEEVEIGREYMRSQGKELGSIGVDRITGNINVMEPNGDFRAVLSSDGEELSAWEMDIYEAKAEKDIEIDIDSAEQITLKGKELDSDKLGTNKKYRDTILKAPDKAFMYKGKPVTITAVDLNDGSVDEPKIYLTVINEAVGNNFAKAGSELVTLAKNLISRAGESLEMDSEVKKASMITDEDGVSELYYHLDEVLSELIGSEARAFAREAKKIIVDKYGITMTDEYGFPMKWR